MTDHPITPPPELFKQWEGQPRSLAFEAAYRAGADQELEACCEWLSEHNWRSVEPALRDARRPKPSLKEQALEVLNEIESGKHGWLRIFDNLTIIRRALEQLDD